MITAPGPCVVGTYLDGVESRFLPVSEAEIERIARHYRQVLQSYDLPPRSHVLVVSLASQVGFVMPLERALGELHMILSYADSSIADAGRVATITRQFDVRAILGVTRATLEGLAAQDCDPAALFAGRIVWADASACAQLAPPDGYLLRQWSELGPAVGVECAAGGGLHLSGEEWQATVSGTGEVCVTSRLPRLVPFKAQPCGMRGVIVDDPCDCGSLDIRVRPS